MPKLKLVSLECRRTDDTSKADDQAFDMTAEDEPYLIANNKRVWGVKRMKANDTEDLSNVEPISFSKDVRIELWDKDAGYWPEDDQIGRLTIQANLAGLGELKHEFKRRNANYILAYKVE